MAKSLRTFLEDCTRESTLPVSGLWSFSYPDIITLPLTPDIITLLQQHSVTHSVTHLTLFAQFDIRRTYIKVADKFFQLQKSIHWE